MTLSRVHALTAAELALLRTRVPAARTDLYLAIWPMFQGVKGDPFNAIVWTARVDEPGGTVDDRLFEIDYDGGSGAADFANTLPDMTVYVGTSAGSDDLGRARLRGFDAGSTGATGTMRLGEMSEIVWQDDAYLTVIDDFNLWPRHIFIDSAGVIYMDHGYYDEVAAANVDGSYTDQHQYPDPVPVLGPDDIGWMPASGNYRVYFDASNSFTQDGGALTYTWAFPGSVANGGLNVAATWAEYNAADAYRADCQVSRNYGPVTSAFTGHRRIWLFDPDNMPTVKFEFQDCAGDYSSGGWSYRVRMWDEARRDEIVDRARCVLFARDWFNGVEQSIGPLTTDQFGGMTLRANIVCNGWIGGESIIWDNEKGNVTFDVQGPQFWFEQMAGFPHGVENSDGVPTDWFQYQNLQVRDGLWSFLHWRSTATRMMDIELTSDSREIAVFSTPIGSLWAQLVAGSFPAILAPPVCDRYGSLIVEIPINHEFTASRAGTPTVIAMSLSDWRDQVDITRRTVSPRSMTDLSGVYYVDTTTASAFFSLSYGHIFGRYGKIGRQERLALFSLQANNNSLCGLVQADAAKEYPQVDYRLAGNYRVADIVPRQRISQTILTADTERGIEWSNKLLLPRSVSFLMQDGLMLVDMTCEEETGEANSVDGEPPPTTPPPPTIPPLPPIPPVEPTPDISYGVVVMCQDQLAISFNFFDQLSPDWYDFDPLGNLVGVFQNVFIGTNSEAYCTTRDDANMTNTGVWYCSNILDAVTGTNTWTLIIPADGVSPSGTADTGYNNGLNKCTFGSIFMSNSDECIALVHGAGNAPPPIGQSGYYKINAGAPAFNALPLFGGAAGFTQQPGDKCLFNTYGWDANFFISCGSAAAGWGSVIYEDGVGVALDFEPPDTRQPTGINNGWFRSWTVIAVPPNSNLYGGGVFNANSEATVAETGGFGITTDWMGLNNTEYLYQLATGAYDLWHNTAGQIGVAATEFGAAVEGGQAAFFPFDTQQVVWVSGSGSAFATQAAVVYTDDQGATWISKDGVGGTSLQTAVGGGANWTGWFNRDTANSVVRIFEF